MGDEIGELQFNFLVEQGLQPSHTVIDVSCGSLRGGVRFIDYLEPFKYFGTDINRALIDRGLELELDEAFRKKVGSDSFIVSDDFEFGFDVAAFDYGLALSVFTHLSRPRIEQCLRNLRPKFAGGKFFATFFIVSEEECAGKVNQKGGVTTFPDQDPFHYTLAQVSDMARNTGWEADFIGDFDHPRNQKMMLFR
jgi:hypothetical protein